VNPERPPPYVEVGVKEISAEFLPSTMPKFAPKVTPRRPISARDRGHSAAAFDCAGGDYLAPLAFETEGLPQRR